MTLSVAGQPTTISDQPMVLLNLTNGYPFGLVAQFSLSFTPDAALQNAPFAVGRPYFGGVRFASGGTTTSLAVPAGAMSLGVSRVQIGDVAGTIVVTLTGLQIAGSGESIAIPSPPPSTTITVPTLSPAISSGSLQITNVTASSFTVELSASSTPRNLTSAAVSFGAASGAQLNGATFQVPLGDTATAWFASSDGWAAGGSFHLKIPFPFAGDFSAIGSVSVVLINSAGPSATVAASLQ
jgi:hypothetical protein